MRHGRVERRRATPSHRERGVADHARALASLARGDFDAAETLFSTILASDPFHVDARHDGAVLALRRGRAREAEVELSEVVRLRPAHATAWQNLCLALCETGELDRACAAGERAVSLSPLSAGAHAALGHARALAGAVILADQAFRRALAIDPDDKAILLRLAALAMQEGKTDESLAGLDRVVTAHPQDVRGLVQRFTVLRAVGRHAEAERDLRSACAAEPSNDDALLALAGYLAGQGRFSEAAAELDRRIGTKTVAPRLHLYRAVYRGRTGRRREAAEDFGISLALDGKNPLVHYHVGELLETCGLNDAAAKFYIEAVELDPKLVDAYARLAVLRFSAGDLTAALALFEHGCTLDAGRLTLAIDMAWARLAACDWRGLERDLGALLARCVDAGEPVPPFTLLALGVPNAGLMLWTRAWAERHVACADEPRSPLPHARTRERIRIGYLSADFKNHATATLVAEVFEIHDRTRFETVAFNIGLVDGSDNGLRLIRSLDRFVDLTSLSDGEAADRIRAEDIDILVDLKGYTQDSRPGILGRRPAPIQVNYLGFPGSMGTKAIDYVIADAIVAPSAHAEQFDEAIVHLPGCYQPNDRNRPTADPLASRSAHGLPGTGFVWCCFNASYKITPLIFDTWMRLLGGVPGSVLWILQTNALAAENLRCAARERGIEPERLVFAPRLPVADHIGRQGLADLFLDTLPVNAHTTASEALWAGLPVLTCLGPHFVSRVAASLLHAVGLPDLITTSLQEYESLALALARDPARLGALRDSLAANRLTCSLFDTPRYVRNYEAALERMVEIHDDGETPKQITVEG